MKRESEAHVANKGSHLKVILKWLLFCLVLVALEGSVYTSQVKIDKIKIASPKKAEFLYLPYHKKMKMFTLGFNEIVGDILYIRAINYFGKHYLSDKNYPYLYQILDATTDLSPHFKIPYEFGAVILAIEANEVEKSNILLEKAIVHNPDHWRFPFYLSFNHFFYLNNFEKAAYHMQAASNLPNSPAYLTKLTARLYAHSGKPELALNFLYQIYENTKDKRLKDEINIRIKEVVIERDIRYLETALGKYQTLYADLPKNLQELEERGVIDKIPTEPFGGDYYINSEGDVLSSMRPERLRLFK